MCPQQSDICASGSAVEHLLAKEGVAGSIPVSRFYFIAEAESAASAFCANKQSQKFLYADVMLA